MENLTVYEITRSYDENTKGIIVEFNSDNENEFTYEYIKPVSLNLCIITEKFVG
ncbi:hypothetical protein MASR1M36_03080 [Candidatus Cloacimonadaceae bacterium]